MTAQLEDVLKINLVLVGVRLLATQDEVTAFGGNVGTEVSESSSSMALNLPPTTPHLEMPQIDFVQKLALDKDRITLELTNDRSTISMDYPSKDSLARLCEVSKLAIDKTDLHTQQLRAYGFNIEAVYNLTNGQTAAEFIAKRILAPNLFHDTGYDVRGGAIKLQTLRGEQRWNVRIEPRLGDVTTSRIFVSLNLHRDESKLPSLDLIRSSFKEVWDQAHTIIGRI